jgi:hypothetical protein
MFIIFWFYNFILSIPYMIQFPLQTLSHHENMFSFAFITFFNKLLQIQTFTTIFSFIFLFLKKIIK